MRSHSLPSTCEFGPAFSKSAVSLVRLRNYASRVRPRFRPTDTAVHAWSQQRRPDRPDRSWEWEMSDPWDGPAGRATRSRTPEVPRQRTGEPDGQHPPGRRASAGRAAARAASGSSGGTRSRDEVRSGRRARTVRRGRRVLRIAAICLSVLILATAGAGWWFYQHLNG